MTRESLTERAYTQCVHKIRFVCIGLKRGTFEEIMGPRTVAAVELVRAGKTANQIAEQFGISPSTVNVLLARVYHRIGVRSVEELRALSQEELDHRLAVNLIARKLKDWKGSMEIIRLWPYVLRELE